MVELRSKLSEAGVLYIPKGIRDCFGRDVRIVSNATAALFFPQETDYEDVLKSLDIIRQDIEHRKILKEKRPPVVTKGE